MRKFKTKPMWKMKLAFALITLTGIILVASACQATPKTGTLEGGVSIGPVFPGPERPDENRPVPAEVFAARKVTVYDETGKSLVQTVDIRQIDQRATGYYSVQLRPGVYMVDINHVGIDKSADVPKKITLKAGEIVTVNLDIDTGIR